MNWGAKVPAGVLFRCEFDLRRVEPLRSSPEDKCEREWFRACPMLVCDSASGDETRADLGREVVGGGPGEGEAEFRANGLARHLGPLEAGALMVVLRRQEQGWLLTKTSCGRAVKER
jgi:hypothetical protein